MSFQIRVPYQGSVQSQGFRPFEAPDTTQQLRQNKQTEDLNIRRQGRQEAAYQQQMVKAKQHREALESARELQELQEFSGTIKELVGEGMTNWMENEKAIGRAEAAKNAPEQMRLASEQFQKEYENAKAQGLNDLAAIEAAGKGVPYLFTDRIKGIGGHRGNAQLIATMEMVGQNLPGKVKGMLSAAKDEEGNPAITGLTDPAVFNGILESSIQSVIAPFGDLNASFRAAHIDPAIAKARASLQKSHQSLYSRTKSQGHQQDLKNQMITGQIRLDQAWLRFQTELDLSKSTETFLGGTGAWKVMMDTLKEGIDAGQLKRQDIIDAFNDGTDGKQTYAERFPRKLEELLEYEQKERIDDGNRTFQLQELEFKQRNEEIRQEVMAKQKELGRPLTEAEINELYGSEEQANLKRFPALEVYRDGLSLDDVQRAAYRSQLQNAVIGKYISVDAVKSIPDYSLQQEFMPLAVKAEAKNRSETYNGYATALDGEIKKIFEIGPNDQMTVEAEAVRQYARGDFDNKYEMFIADGMGEAQAAAAAAFAVQQDIANKVGFYDHSGVNLKDRFPKIGPDETTQALYNDTQLKFSDLQRNLNAHGKKALGMQGTFGTEDEVKATLKEFSESGKINNAAMRYTASIMDENRLHILSKAAGAYGLKVEFPEPRALVPGTNRILNNEPTAKQIQRLKAKNGVRRMSNSSEMAWVPTAAQGLTPMERAWLRTIRYAEGTHTDQGYGTHFGGSYSEPGAAHPDRVITAGGYSSAAYGAYQFMPNTWQSTGGGPMTPERQDKAALELMRRRGVTGSQPLSPGLAAKLAPEWASFPNLSGVSHYEQPVKSYQQLERFFNNALAEEQFGTY